MIIMKEKKKTFTAWALISAICTTFVCVLTKGLKK